MNIIQSNLSFRSLSYGNNPNKIVLHHAEASNCSVESIHSWHKDGNGWAGIGYHYFVKKNGQIYSGRPENAVGAHCPGQNSQSIGICAEGMYMSEYMPNAQKNAIIELGIYLKNKYGISEVGGHRDYYSTDCPGTNYPLSEIRNAILNGNYSESVTTSNCGSRLLLLASPLMYGQDIMDLQNKLNKLGYNIDVDGYYGQNTYTAVVQAQSNLGVSADGIVGNNTLNAINNAIEKINNKNIKEEIKVKNIVCYNNIVDARAAGYLSDYLQCPLIDNSLIKFDYTVVDKIYCVGGGTFTSYATKIIKGDDRYDTCQAVLDFIKNN